MKKLFSIILVGGIIAGGYFAYEHFSKGGQAGASKAGMAGMSPTVALISVEEKEIVKSIKKVGRVEAKQITKLVPHVEGYLQKRHFEEGAYVKKGDLLFTIEQDKYSAAANEARANVENLKAALWESENNLKRAEELIAKDYISKSEYDNKLAVRDQNKAALESGKALLKKVSYDLEKTKIYAPISGKIGSIDITEGNLVGPGSGAIATIVKTDPVYVNFHMPAADYSKIKLDLAKKGQSADKYKVSLLLAGGEKYPHSGIQNFSDNVTDQTTGTVKLRATFPNPDNILIPGQFVNLVLTTDKAQKKVTVPQSMVLEDPIGHYVLTVDEKGTVASKRITTSQQHGKDWVVEEGLKPGDKVIPSGLQKLRPGMPVKVAPEKTEEAKDVQ